MLMAKTTPPMPFCGKWRPQIWLGLLLLLSVFGVDLCSGDGGGFCSSPPPAVIHHHGDEDSHGGHHHGGCDHGHDHHHRLHSHRHDHDHVMEAKDKRQLLPEELAEEEDMRLYGFGNHRHDHHSNDDHDSDLTLSGLGLWLNALGCSLLVSLASLICLTILPIIFIQGKPSKAVVDALALFGAGAMLGDAFLHQLPHAFGGGHSHSHDHHVAHEHHAHDEQVTGHSHAHSLEDLSVGLSVLAGIVLFLLVEKVVRYVEENSNGANAWSHGHRHHHHKSSKKLKNEDDVYEKRQSQSSKQTEVNGSNEVSDNKLNGTQHETLQKRKVTPDNKDHLSSTDAAEGSTDAVECTDIREPAQSSSTLVFGYLNLFSDGIHNFTDGMALGSAFLLYGSVGGWSRTLFLLAHEIPQEVGDFGILVRSGFTVSKALFFNFLSALVALVGTALALLWGQDPGHSSLIEGFTAGGFIYISVAGVLAEINNSRSTWRSTAVQLTSLLMGMAVALCISLVE